MASGFLVLQRFFLRVDGVMVRINDTRLYHAAQTDYLLREYTSKEAKIKDLRVCNDNIYSQYTHTWTHTTNMNITCTLLHIIFLQLPPSMLTDPNKLNAHLPLTSTIVHKLIIPTTTQSDT